MEEITWSFEFIREWELDTFFDLETFASTIKIFGHSNGRFFIPSGNPTYGLLRRLQMDTANWPDFMDNIANIGHCKEKQWNMYKVKKSRTQWEVVCQSICQAIVRQTRILRLSDMTLEKA